MTPEVSAQDAARMHAAGNAALKSGDAQTAAAHFEAASKAQPGNLDYALDQAIALQRLQNHSEVIALLTPRADAGKSSPRYASVRALSHKSLGQIADAAEWYDVALSLNAKHPRAMHGRARIALERGEPDALARFDAAVAVNPGDADLWLGKANALDMSGDAKGALIVAKQIADQAPSYLPGQYFLAQMRLAHGEKDFASHYSQAAARHPQDPNILAAHCEVLAGLEYTAEAADVAAEARRRFPNIERFAFLEAVHSGTAGDWDRADAIFAGLTMADADRFLQEARHRLRAGDADEADVLLGKSLAQQPERIAAWALRGIVWRLTNDPRAQWLHGQDGLVQSLALRGADDLVERAIASLRTMHAHSAMPLGQSLRGGTQTRGILFHHVSPVMQELREAIRDTLEDYRSALPAHDPSHPLLRHRNDHWEFAGSWSVRLTGGGDFHTSHIHPLGVISSALYLIVPVESADDVNRPGWLEIGRPPPDLGLELEPLRTIQPQPGHLALFPSTLYHGTTPFTSAERITTAFDVVSHGRPQTL